MGGKALPRKGVRQGTGKWARLYSPRAFVVSSFFLATPGAAILNVALGRGFQGVVYRSPEFARSKTVVRVGFRLTREL